MYNEKNGTIVRHFMNSFLARLSFLKDLSAEIKTFNKIIKNVD